MCVPDVIRTTTQQIFPFTLMVMITHIISQEIIYIYILENYIHITYITCYDFNEESRTPFGPEAARSGFCFFADAWAQAMGASRQTISRQKSEEEDEQEEEEKKIKSPLNFLLYIFYICM